MANKNRYAIYQLRDDDPELDKIRGMPYNDLLRARIQIDPENYTQMYMSGMQENEDAYRIFDRLRRFTPSDFPGEPIGTSDILTIIVDEFPTAFYIDGDKLVLISDFYKNPGDNRLVCLDNDEYVIEGKNGIWTPVTMLVMKGIPFYEMKDARDPRGMHILVSFDGKVVAENFRTLSQDVANRTGQHLELWQKYYENGEYVRSLADYAGSMVNYSRVDGSRGNQDKDYTEEIMQAQVGRASGKSKDEQARAESEQTKASYRDRIAHAKQEADTRVTQRNSTQTQEQDKDEEREDPYQVILDHVEKLEEVQTNRINNMEAQLNKRLTRLETQDYSKSKRYSRSVDDELERNKGY